ncbi:NAD(P)H-binding protein [Kineococcus aurantiacus]|uniref:NAD(P)H dehydrogenase (Quinone) n=1 Tax=Kineococcus aurantiacus TaxID=37633 RepID=A0A7Y9AUK0_9ACTN|nr:NAD(P)H-binding protein [Kineococcus aurantiacus]NYD21714.1 NAD(P)H dehydrogenase (quinone) [Kineococcus aurantiacus]
MTTYAVTAASGHLGRLAVEALLERGVPAADVVAVVRTPAKVADLADRGVVVRPGDYSDPASLPAALAGVDRLLLVSGSEVGQRVAQHTNVVEAAKAAGVQRIVYTSLLRADTTQSPLAPEHKATEEVLAASGLQHVVLRNSWYLENYTERLGEYLGSGQVLGATHGGKVSAATRADYAAAAAAALVGEDTTSRTHELAGTTFDFTELAATITDVTGTTVVSRDLPGEEYEQALTGFGLDAGTAGFVAALDASIARGDLFTDSRDLEQLIGRPATTLAEAVRAAHTAA